MLKIYIFLLTVILFASTGHTKEIAGINFPDVHEISQTELILNGVGLRTKFFLQLYAGGLYLEQKSSQPKQIILADSPMAIRLHIVSSMITSEKMEAATREGFEKATDNNISLITSQIEQFILVFKEKIQENDIYDLVYSPDKGVTVYKNDKIYSSIVGLNFKQALFGIWLCDNPAQESLKTEMLGE
jgi:hypothetical protein